MEIFADVAVWVTIILGAITCAAWRWSHDGVFYWSLVLTVIIALSGAFCAVKSHLAPKTSPSMVAKTLPETHAATPDGNLQAAPKEANSDQPQVNIPASPFGPSETDSIVLLGKMVVSTPDPQICILRQGDEDVISIERQAGKVLLSAKIFDKDGNAICVINRNRFHLNSKKYLFADQSENSLTVVDDDGKTVIQIDIIDDRTIRLLGDFYARNRQRIVIKQNEFDVPGFRFVIKYLHVAQGETIFHID